MLVDWTDPQGPLVATGGHEQSKEDKIDLISLLEESNKEGPDVYRNKGFMEPRGFLVGKADQFKDNDPAQGRDPKNNYYEKLNWYFGRELSDRTIAWNVKRNWYGKIVPIFPRVTKTGIILGEYGTPAELEGSDLQKLLDPADENCDKWYISSAYDCVGVPYELKVASGSTVPDIALVSFLKKNDIHAPAGPLMTTGESLVSTDDNINPNALNKRIKRLLERNDDQNTGNLKRLVGELLSNHTEDRSIRNKIRVHGQTWITSVDEQFRKLTNAQKSNGNHVRRINTKRDLLVGLYENALLSNLFDFIKSVVVANGTIRIMIADDRRLIYDGSYSYTLDSSALTKGRFVVESKTDHVFLFGPLFGKYTSDVISMELRRREQHSYWFPSPAVLKAKAEANHEKVYTKTNKSRLEKWLNKPNPKKGGSPDAGGIQIAQEGASAVHPTLGRFVRAVGSAISWDPAKKTTPDQPQTEVQRALTRLLQDTSSTATYWVGSWVDPLNPLN
tara:strand:+ start:824 stop:2332 length:1509 start_codon:yes stop_codon:yes gene_type:complete